MTYHYYLAATGSTYGDDASVLEKLRNTYGMLFNVHKAKTGETRPGHFDGASLMPDGRVFVVVGCNGTGTGETFTVEPRG